MKIEFFYRIYINREACGYSTTRLFIAAVIGLKKTILGINESDIYEVEMF